MTDIFNPGNTVIRTYTFKDENGVLYDPSSVAVTIIDPSASVVATKALSDLVKLSTGVYELYYNLASDARAGQWIIAVSSTYAPNSLVAAESYGFTVVSASPTFSSYCLPGDVKNLSQIAFNQLGFVDDASFSGFLSDTLIPQAQRLVDQFCNHNFGSQSGTVKLDGRGKRAMLIPPPYVPIQSVSSVQIDGVEVIDSIKVYDTYIWSDTRVFTENKSRRQNVQVVLTYGYSSVPSEVSYVTAQLAANILTDMVRRKLMPDTMAKAMQVNADTVVVSGFGRSPQVFTGELKEMLVTHIFSKIDVTGSPG